MIVKKINTQRVLSPTNISLAPYAINPYRGCEFSCLYCYSQTNKNLKNKFFNFLGIKTNAPALLQKELRYRKPSSVVIGTTTECFQYQEKKYRITKKIIKILNEHNISYTILTKSTLIREYLNLISSHKNNKIYFTFNWDSNLVLRIFEKGSPAIEERASVLKEIIAKGINLRIHIGPFLPCLSSLKNIFKLLPPKVKEVDIEIYNPNQGNFLRVLEKIHNNFGKAIKEKVKNIYQKEENYIKFSQQLKEEIFFLSQKNGFKFKIFYIVPKFNSFYSSCIDYEKALF